MPINSNMISYEAGKINLTKPNGAESLSSVSFMVDNINY